MKAVLQIGVWLCLSFATMAQSVPGQSLHGHVPSAIAHLTPVGRLEKDRELNLAIGLPLRNKEELTSLLHSIYDPTSPDYHHYLTPAQFAGKFGPSEEDYQAVKAFATANGFKMTATYPNRILLDVAGSVSNIEKAFNVTMRTYAHPKENRVFYAPDVEPSLNLTVPILHISGLDNYLQPHPLADTYGLVSTNGSGPGGTYMGKDFRAAYVPGTSLTGAGQTVGLLEFNSGYYQSDITAYENLAGLPNVPVSSRLLDGYNGGLGDGYVEVTLDIDMAISMAPDLTGVIVYEGSYTDDILEQMATDDIANQLSASWSYPIDDVSEEIFQQFQAQGQSFFNASGDSDAYFDGIISPSDDPNITIVGGTTLTTSGPRSARISETVWNWGVEYGGANDGIGSSGGISTEYPIPSWQTNISMIANQGSTFYRNIPDVALTADNVYVIADGTGFSVGGTSCATPLWAAFISLANEQAVASGRPLLGFINPVIYALGRSTNYTNYFHDITTGNNTNASSLTKFFAVTGYDLCTGWGTPNGTALINTLAPPRSLQISPATGFTGTGRVGGPFTVTTEILTLTNSGTTALAWTLTNSASWLSVSPVSGNLSPGGLSSTTTVSLNVIASNLVAGNYISSMWFTNLNDGTGQSRLFTLTVITPPTITNSPISQSVLMGAAAEFTVGAMGGTPITFQWQKGGTNLTDSGNISGSITAALTITNVSSTNVGSYEVVVSNAAGAITSTPPAMLTITLSKPVITEQPASQYVEAGSSAQFMVFALGNAPLFYQWYFNNSILTNATNATLSLPNVTTNQAGTYDVVVSNFIGSTLSSNATLTVLAATPASLSNGSFESPTITQNSDQQTTPTAWNWSGSEGFIFNGTVGIPWPLAEDGQQYVDIGYSSAYALSQTFTNSIEGYYQLVWFDNAASISTGSPYSVNVINSASQTVGSTNLNSTHGGTWNQNEFILNLSVGTYTLKFSPSGAEYDTLLDNVSLFALLSPMLSVQHSGKHVVLSWTNTAFSLQAAPAVTGTYTNIPDATSPYTNTITGSQTFFRLISN